MTDAIPYIAGLIIAWWSIGLGVIFWHAPWIMFGWQGNRVAAITAWLTFPMLWPMAFIR